MSLAIRLKASDTCRSGIRLDANHGNAGFSIYLSLESCQTVIMRSWRQSIMTCRWQTWRKTLEIHACRSGMTKMHQHSCARRAHWPAVVSLLMAVSMLSGCIAPSNRITKPEEFADTDVHSHTFGGSPARSCEAARRALLSQGYIISENKETLVRGQKNFQPDSEIHIQIEFNVVCAPDGRGSNSTTTFANAVRDRYSLKKSSTSASVGVSVLGSLSLPFGFNDDAMVKVASETIDSKKFYQQFFDLVERYFDSTSTVPETAAVAEAPALPPRPPSLVAPAPVPGSITVTPENATPATAPASTPAPAAGETKTAPATTPITSGEGG